MSPGLDTVRYPERRRGMTSTLSGGSGVWRGTWLSSIKTPSKWIPQRSGISRHIHADTVFLTEMMMIMKYILWYSQISCVFSQQIAIIILAIQHWTSPSFIAFLFKNLVIIKYFKLGKELQLLHSRKFKIDNFLTITQMHRMASASLSPYLTSHSRNYLNIGKTILSFPAKYLLNSELGVGEMRARLSVTA